MGARSARSLAPCSRLPRRGRRISTSLSAARLSYAWLTAGGRRSPVMLDSPRTGRTSRCSRRGQHDGFPRHEVLAAGPAAELWSVSHLLHMMFVLGLCGSLCHPCFVKPAPSCESACSPSCKTLVLFLADM